MTTVNKFVNGKPVNTTTNNGGEKPLEPKMITVKCVYKSFNFNLTINEERQKELGIEPVRSGTISLGEALSLGEKAFMALSGKALEVGKAKETKALEEEKVKAEEKAKAEEAKKAKAEKLEAAIALFKEAGIIITKEMIAGKPQTKPQPKVETKTEAKPQTESKAKPQASIKDGAVKYLKACVQGKMGLPQKGQVKTLMEDLTGLTWSSQTAEGIRLSREEGVVYISFETGFYKAHEETCHTAFQAVREALRFTGLEYKKMDKGRLPITFRAL
jgi:predicted HTH domain antitoxin